MTKEEYIKTAHQLSAYEISEQADQKQNDFDALWQSLYDVCQLGTYGILDMDQEEINEAMIWLKETQPLTEEYKDLTFDFEEDI